MASGKGSTAADASISLTPWRARSAAALDVAARFRPPLRSICRHLRHRSRLDMFVGTAAAAPASAAAAAAPAASATALEGCEALHADEPRALNC